ncbi:MAG TPA: hypothetical protein VGI19_04330 [Candidatus Cybelea sp.]|jgi:hypothetical protein
MRTFAQPALSISLAAALLAGCGGSQSIGAPGAISQKYAINGTKAAHHKTFNYTGAEQSFKVPAGVTRIDVDARGAAGAGNYNSGHHGGQGGRVRATISVQPGQTLDVFVGGEASYSGETGGFNGGGNGGGTTGCAGGAGGGGGSDVREGGDTLPDRILVAGGGGGAGSNLGSGGFNGGGGGGKKGDKGEHGGRMDGSGGGGGGSQSKGGAGGYGGGGKSHEHGYRGDSGALGLGGNGGTCGFGRYLGGSGGGGGGGYYGGGGGGGGAFLSLGGGGGGGSGYVQPSANNVHFLRDWYKATGNGKIVLSW